MQDDIKKARALLEVVGPLDLAEFEYSDGEVTIRFCRDGVHAGAPAVAAAPAPAVSAAAPAPAASAAPAPAATSRNQVEICSPMVGTYYSAPAPDKPPYVQSGMVVEAGQVVCIIEAMKLMNEIKSPSRGRIVEVLVENAEAVGKDQVLFHLEPA